MFIIAPVRRIAIAMNLPSLDPFWYQQFDLRQNSILKAGQPIVDVDALDNCRLYVTTMKEMDFHDDIPSILIDKSKNRYVLVFDLISMQDALENCHYLELFGMQLRLKLNFILSIVHVNELIVNGKSMSLVAVDKFCVVRKSFQNG